MLCGVEIMVNIFVREKGYVTIKGYERAAHLVATLEERTERTAIFIDFEVDESYYGGLTEKKYEKIRKVHIRCSDIITVEDIS